MLHAIHVDDSKHPEHYSYGAENPEAEDYHAPILADDEIDAGPDVTAQHPAIRPGFDRSRSYDTDEPKKPSIRHPTMAHDAELERGFSSTPLEDLEEYEPLFDEEKKEEQKQAAAEKRASRHFPSKDIWEDAPSSVHYSTEVSTPDVEEQNQRPKSKSSFSENRSITPAQAFAQYQEELAEKEGRGRANNFLPLSADTKPTWIDRQSHLGLSKPSSARRFPSKDVWEDAPDSHIQEATLSESALEDDSKPDEESDEKQADKPEDVEPETLARAAKKGTEESRAPPAIPNRPKPRQASDDDIARQPPAISDKPKPQLPSRPVKKLSGDSKDGEAVKPPKPPVPSRPVGGKIAALQAGFMSDLNKRLQLGPQTMKKEEPAQEEEAVEKEKVPLSDARKGRARGPQRRAPAKAASPVNESSTSTLSISQPQTLWSIDPEEGVIVTEEPHEAPKAVSKTASQEPHEDLAKTTSHESNKDIGSPLTTGASEDSKPLLVKWPSQDTTKPEAVPTGGELDVTAQTNPAEPTPAAKDDLAADVQTPAVKPAIQAVDETSKDIVSSKLSTPEVEEKPILHVHDHDAAHEAAVTEKDIGDVPLAQAKGEEAA